MGFKLLIMCIFNHTLHDISRCCRLIVFRIQRGGGVLIAATAEAKGAEPFDSVPPGSSPR